VPRIRTPLVTIPSTFAGSEANGASAVNSSDSLGKRVLYHSTLTPVATIIDADILRTTPKGILLASAMNCINHCVEGVSSRNSSAESRLLLETLLPSFVSECDQISGEAPPASSYSNGSMLSVLIGSMLPSVWLGVCHAIGHVLGAQYSISHGLSHSILAPESVRLRSSEIAERHESLLRSLGMLGSSEELAEWLRTIARQWELPS
jgi:maleylacetate reductase